MSDEVRDHCGVFGIYGHPRASEIAYLGLFALQHRGEESAGISTSDGKQLHLYKNLGLVGDVFDGTVMNRLIRLNPMVKPQPPPYREMIALPAPPAKAER